MKIMNIPVDGLTYYLKRDSWLRDFSMNDVKPVECDKLAEHSFLEKRDNIIETYFYKKDYEKLAGLLEHSSKDLCSKKAGCHEVISQRQETSFKMNNHFPDEFPYHSH